MYTKTADHEGGEYLMRTSYDEIATERHPSLGPWIWKGLVVAASVATVRVVRRTALAVGGSAGAIALIALSPLLVLEAGVGAHVDALAAFEMRQELAGGRGFLPAPGPVNRFDPPTGAETLHAYLVRLGVDLSGPVIVAVDRAVIPRDWLTRVRPKPGTLISVRAAVAGGDGSQVVATTAPSRKDPVAALLIWPVIPPVC